MITFADVFVYEQFGDMINILHEMCLITILLINLMINKHEKKRV